MYVCFPYLSPVYEACLHVVNEKVSGSFPPVIINVIGA